MPQKNIKPFFGPLHLKHVQNFPRFSFICGDGSQIAVAERGKENAGYFGTKFDNDACN